jgi:hypothetical protein
LVFASPTDWAGPVGRKGLERRSGSYAIVRVSHGGIIFVGADYTNVLFHVFLQKVVKVGKVFLLGKRASGSWGNLPTPSEGKDYKAP